MTPRRAQPEDRDPEHYVRGAPEAAKLLGGVTRPRVHHLVAAGRLRSWPATLIFPGVRSKDAAYYIPDLLQLRVELEEDARSYQARRRRRVSGGANDPEPMDSQAS